MNPEAVLDNLAPLREPEAISWWPLAYGWWVVAALTLIALGSLATFAWRRYRANRYRRTTLRMLDQLIANERATLETINRLLKAASLKCWPAADVAQLHGKPWTTFLIKSVKKPLASDAFDPLEDVYSAPETRADKQLISVTRHWLKHHRRSHD